MKVRSKTPKLILLFGIILFGIIIVWILLNFVFVFCIPNDNTTLRIILSTISSVLVTYLEKFINNNLWTTLENSEKNNKNPKTSKIYIFLSIFLIAIGILIQMIGEIKTSINKNELNGSPTVDNNAITYSDNNNHAISQTIVCDISNPLVDYDVYFSDLNKTELLESLFATLQNIPEIYPISDNELNASTVYGGISKMLNSYDKELTRLLSDPILKNGPLPKEAAEYIITNRLKMESEYQTPSNRQCIADAYLSCVIYNLSNNKIDDAEKAIRFTWGKIYLEIAWNRFKSKSFDNLISMYEHLGSNNSEKKDRVHEIINVLEILQIRSDEQKFQPKSIK